jgi:hypothetical protein
VLKGRRFLNIEQPGCKAFKSEPLIWAGRLDTFGKGWAKADIPLLMSVFAENAVFVETPFSEPRRGRDAILVYWRDVPVHQAEIVFTSGEIFAAGPWFSTEFRRSVAGQGAGRGGRHLRFGPDLGMRMYGGGWEDEV